jgi:predicted regulator of Ras-like GTPase activity (Roadblock/LC7/MglB family)
MFKESLEKIVDNCDGAVAAVLMGFDGIAVETISKDDAVDVQTISMEFSFVLGQVRKAAEILEVGALEEVSIRSENLTFIIRVLNEEYFFGAALKPNGNFGKGRFLMRMAFHDLLKEL